MSWTSVGENTKSSGEMVVAPLILALRNDHWRGTLLGGQIDEMTSDPGMIDFVCSLVRYMEPKVIVEVGTYRGITTVCMAEVLRFYKIPGHIWTCDPTDYEVMELAKRTGMESFITYVKGGLEEVLPMLDTQIDLTYVDATEPKNGDSLRLRMADLALKNTSREGCVVVDDVNGNWNGSGIIRRMANCWLPQRRGVAILTR